MKFIYKLLNENLVKNFFSLGAATVVTSILSLIVGIITRNVIGPKDYGVWLTISLVFVYGPLLHFGTLNALNREIPYYLVRSDTEKVIELKNVAFSSLFILPSPVIAILFGIVTYVFVMDNDWKMACSLLLSIVILSLTFISNFVEILYKSEQKFGAASKTILIRNIIQAVGTLVTVYIWGYYGLFIGPLLGLSVQILSSLEIFKGITFLVNKQSIIQMIKIGFPVLIIGLIWSLMTGIDRILITIFLTANELGHYSVALLIFNAMMLVPQVVGQITYPKLFEIKGRGNDAKELLKFFKKGNYFIAIAMIVITILSYLCIPVLIRIFLPNYVAGIRSAQILALGIYPLTLVGMAANILHVLEKQRIYVIALILTATVNILACILLLQLNNDIVSISIGTSISYVIYCLFMNYCAIKYLSKEVKKLEDYRPAS